MFLQTKYVWKGSFEYNSRKTGLIFSPVEKFLYIWRNINNASAYLKGLKHAIACCVYYVKANDLQSRKTEFPIDVA